MGRLEVCVFNSAHSKAAFTKQLSLGGRRPHPPVAIALDCVSAGENLHG